MNLLRIARISGLCLILFMTALTAFAQPQGAPRCGCQLCSNVDPARPCTLDGEVTTCGFFLAVALCPARPPADPADSMSSFEGLEQEPASCMNLGG